ncbi:unnamed protein product [Tetraodon nigroviridis]|uniref:(spotted green pufferfish) hypothetical protein n=1 Tax=Tetraodon nigroviridis TaxID=99883 RepID=Q4RN74_TETNG|nr:unnamed protein product [Tetraodon nigroviridis]
MYSSRVAPGACYVAALCPPATVSIEQVKIPVGGRGVYTQRKVPESNASSIRFNVVLQRDLPPGGSRTSQKVLL